jgi:hypothetical protein
LTTQFWAKLTVEQVNDFRDKKGWTPISRSTCFNCGESAYWYEDRMMVPSNVGIPLPSPDLPAALKSDYMEAREIFNASPRGAAALLRLVIQKLMPALGEAGKDINTDIGELVKKGRINPRTQKMLDSVRVIGNEAVHPGVLDVRDNRELASSLFSLVNLIMFEAVTYDKYVDGIYQQLPENKRKGIEDRDRPKAEKAG